MNDQYELMYESKDGHKFHYYTGDCDIDTAKQRGLDRIDELGWGHHEYKFKVLMKVNRRK